MTKKAEVKTGKIAAYVAKYSNPSSGAGYRLAIEAFLRCMFNLQKLDDNGKKIPHNYEEYLERYLQDKKRNHSTDIKTYSECLVKECVSRQSAKQILTYGVKFLRAQGINILADDVLDIKRETKGGSGTVDKPLTANLICQILRGADVRNRAVFLMLASSGLRIGELLSLETDDVDLKTTPAIVNVRASKTKNKTARYSFITPEAVDAVKLWLENRTEYLKQSAKHNRNLMNAGVKTAPVQTESTLLFPVSDSQINAGWEACLKKAGLYARDSETQRNQYRLHSLRKFFITQVSMAAPEKLAQYLAGHNGYLDKSYLRVDPSYAAAEYAKIMHVLTCCVPETVKVEIKTLKQETATLKKQDGLQMESIEYLRENNARLQDRLNAMEKDISELRELKHELIGVIYELKKKPTDPEYK